MAKQSKKAGRPKKFKEKSKVVSFRVPLSKEFEFKKLVDTIVEDYIIHY